jgi:lysophospholipase L1-like esterase
MGPVATPTVRRRPAFKTILLAVVVMPLVTLLGVEIGLRVFFTTNPKPAGDPISCTAPDWCNPPLDVRHVDSGLPYGYDNRPNVERFIPLADHDGGGYVFRTNGFGLRRDDHVEIPKPPGVFRVLVLGDSQVEGYVDNDEHYPHHLEQLLREQRGRDARVEVLNAGTGGYGPLGYYHWLRTRGRALDPDLVIVTVYLGNDLMDFAFGETMRPDADDMPTATTDWRYRQAVHERWTRELSDLPRAASEWLPRAADDLLYDQSVTYQILQASVNDGPLTIPLIRFGLLEPRPYFATGGSVFPRLFGECHGCWPQYFAQMTAATPVRLARAEDRLATVLKHLKRDVDAQGGRLAVVMLPTKPVVEPSDVHDIITHSPEPLGIDRADLDRLDGSVAAAVRTATERAAVPVIDPLPGLTEAARSRRLYYQRDWHLNPDGHRALAEIVHHALASEGLVHALDELDVGRPLAHSRIDFDA